MKGERLAREGIMTKLLAVLGMAAAVGAGSAEAGVNERQAGQRARIAHHVRTGDLTARETARLAAEQARIRREEFRYRHNDGRLGPWERAELARELNQASRHIYRQSHDGQYR
jgi:hypothetical protein